MASVVNKWKNKVVDIFLGIETSIGSIIVFDIGKPFVSTVSLYPFAFNVVWYISSEKGTSNSSQWVERIIIFKDITFSKKQPVY